MRYLITVAVFVVTYGLAAYLTVYVNIKHHMWSMFTSLGVTLAVGGFQFYWPRVWLKWVRHRKVILKLIRKLRKKQAQGDIDLTLVQVYSGLQAAQIASNKPLEDEELRRFRRTWRAAKHAGWSVRPRCNDYSGWPVVHDFESLPASRSSQSWPE